MPALLDFITRFYLNSGPYFGVPLTSLKAPFGYDEGRLLNAVTRLVNEGTATLEFGDHHPNPYVKALPGEAPATQLKKLRTPLRHQACVFPSAFHLRRVVDREAFQDRPFSLELAQGEPRLNLVAFHPSIIECYALAANYTVEAGLEGVIRHQGANGKQELIIPQYTTGYDASGNRVVGVRLDYLAALSPAHQRLWIQKRLKRIYQFHPDYVAGLHKGVFPERRSVFQAFLEELRAINTLSRSLGRPALFARDYLAKQDLQHFAPLNRPSQEAFARFFLEFQVLLIQELNQDFFGDDHTDRFIGAGRYEKLSVRSQTPLERLDTWSCSHFRLPASGPFNKCCSLIREIRSHLLNLSPFTDPLNNDPLYRELQRDLMRTSYASLHQFRQMLEKESDLETTFMDPLAREGQVWTM